MENRHLFRGKTMHIMQKNEHLDGKWITGYLSGEHYISNETGEHLVDPETICQCTGYEGMFEHDIFRCGDEVYEILWSQEDLKWEAYERNGNCIISLNEFRSGEIEVLGNSLDSPELMQEKRKKCRNCGNCRYGRVRAINGMNGGWYCNNLASQYYKQDVRPFDKCTAHRYARKIDK